MFNLAVTFIAAALLAPSAIVGQTLSACVTNCTTVALPAGNCTDLTDLTCICGSTDFASAAAACITQDCPADLAGAETALTQECASLNGTTGSTSDAGTGSSTSAAVVTPGGTTTRPAGTTTHPATTSTSRPASTTGTTSTGAGFHTASIASGVTLALFGAAFSLF